MGIVSKPKKLLIVAGIVLGALVTCVGIVLWVRSDTNLTASALNNQLSQGTKTVSFTPFYYRPKSEPVGGFYYKKNSLRIDAQLISFAMTSSAGKTIAITQQAKPNNFDATAYNGRLQKNVAAGRAVIGANQNNTSAAIFGDKTMLFIKSDAVIDDTTLEVLLSSFSVQ